MAADGLEPHETDHYAVLGLENKRHDAQLSMEALKLAYRQALLAYHPDKAPTQRQGAEHSGASAPSVDSISTAFRVLSDPVQRRAYDQLHAARTNRQHGGRPPSDGPGTEVVDLEDLNYDEAAGVWSRTCRCGSKPAYVVSESDLEAGAAIGEVAVGCQGCSLWIRVQYGVAE